MDIIITLRLAWVGRLLIVSVGFCLLAEPGRAANSPSLRWLR
jgi:hypothetical protein